MNISRREAIKKAAMVFGGSFLVPDILKAWDSSPALNQDFRLSFEQEDTLEELCETILPTTDTPGAKAAGVPKFVRKMIADCHIKKDQEEFAAGLDQINQAARAQYQVPFAKATTEQRTAILKEVEASKSRFWSLAKQLTVTGYFTSEVGLTKATRYEQVPGAYDGAYPYKKGDKIFTGG
jgi:hypothetical protein